MSDYTQQLQDKKDHLKTLLQVWMFLSGKCTNLRTNITVCVPSSVFGTKAVKCFMPCLKKDKRLAGQA